MASIMYGCLRLTFGRQISSYITSKLESVRLAKSYSQYVLIRGARLTSV